VSWRPREPHQRAGMTPTTAAAAEGRVLPFKRRAVRPPRRKATLGTLLKPLVTAMALVVMPLAVVTWLTTSPAFAVDEVLVDGVDRVDRHWVLDHLSPHYGRNLLWIDLEAAARPLGDHPWIDGLVLRKELPNRLAVTVRERRPAAVVNRDGVLCYAEETGRVIAPVGAGEPLTGLLRVDGDGGGEATVPRALEIHRELSRLRPDWSRDLSRVEVLSDNDFRLETGALPFVLLVRRDDIDSKLRRLEEVLPHLEERFGSPAAVDLRFARRILLQPARPVASGGATPGETR
jgi:cell division septal protein FtsQ